MNNNIYLRAINGIIYVFSKNTLYDNYILHGYYNKNAQYRPFDPVLYKSNKILDILHTSKNFTVLTEEALFAELL
jgi:hypothetical protein